MNFEDQQEELCSRINIDFDDIANNDLFSLVEVKRWINLAKNEAVARHPWPFAVTEVKSTATAVANTNEVSYPIGMKSNSIRYLTVGGERYQKVIYEDFLKYLEDYEDGEEKIFSDFARNIHLNSNAFDGGERINIYGEAIVSDMTGTSETTPFAAAESEGDEAIIKLAYSKALGSEKMKNPTKARKERIEALEMLDGIWKRISGKKHTYQTKDTPLFKRFDVLKGEFEEDISNPNQF